MQGCVIYKSAQMHSQTMGISRAGSILATWKVFSRAKLTPTQNISALPTKDNASISTAEITAPKL